MEVDPTEAQLGSSTEVVGERDLQKGIRCDGLAAIKCYQMATYYLYRSLGGLLRKIPKRSLL